MAAAPLDTKNTPEKDLNSDRSSMKSGTVAGEITKSFIRHQLNSDNPSPASTHKPPGPRRSPATPKPLSSSAARKLRNASPKVSTISIEDDSRSVFSVQSERNNRRRHSIAGSSIRDDESLDSSPSIPSYMTPTRSAKARLKSQSPSGMENGSVQDKETTVFAKKRLSFPSSPGRARRHSGPPRVEMGSVINGSVNGGSVN